MLTRRGWGVLAGAVVAWLAGRILGVGELYVVAVAAAALVGAAALAVQLGESRIAVRRRLSTARARPDHPVEVTIDLRNDGRIHSGALLVEDTCPYYVRASLPGSAHPRFLVPGIPPGRARTLTYDLLPSWRGRWRIGPLQFHVGDPFGAVRRTRTYRSTTELVVYPRVEELPTGPLFGAHVGAGRSDRRRLLGSGEEFHTIREYRTGDDLRRVHWPSTAKQQQLMVRQHEQGWAARATVLLDDRTAGHRGRGEHGTFEACVTAAASVLVHLDRRGYESRLLTGGDDARARSVEPIDRHLERLAVVEPVESRSLRLTLDGLRHADGLLVVVLAPPEGAVTTDPEIRALVGAGRRFSSKVTVVAPGPGSDELTTLLMAAGWRAATLDGGVAAAWRRVLTQSIRTVPA